MSKQTIEFAGEAVGALMPDNGQLRFVAVKYSVWPLDGRLFATPEDARKAIATLHVLRQWGPPSATPSPAGRIIGPSLQGSA
ncbi:hypothetical protein PYH37_002961 [Sinorhizobium numidicum]|uniref:Uncharacterized protein n=1 Tax=Sinorhizobium numidicum TaxID=680248 RepID=A0ABY8D1J7_9HYPH|nr:hypothetical protein [Sinorhizobium numidicum]WEX78109.1 hypothetical protein PYH37_002961 [Sinorhizobium numidicum]WEX84768.1 hypothetical protein PYH38_003674 [Sinorhizobium numidicum]